MHCTKEPTMAKKIIEFVDDKTLKKNRSIVQMSDEMTVFQRQSYNALLKVAQEQEINDKKKKTNSYKMSISRLRTLLNLSTETRKYEDIIKPLRELQRKQFVEIQTDTFESIPLLYAFKITKSTGTIEWKIDEKIRAKLLESDFFSLSLETNSKFTSTYALALYEQILRTHHNKKKDFQELELTIKEFREYMAIPKKQYKLYGHLKNRVILPSITEINEHTDFYICAEERKERLKVVGICFHFAKVSKAQKDALMAKEKIIKESKK